MYGVLVYLPVGTALDGTLPQRRYGIEEMYVTNRNLLYFVILVPPPDMSYVGPKNRWENERAFYDVYIVPYVF